MSPIGSPQVHESNLAILKNRFPLTYEELQREKPELPFPVIPVVTEKGANLLIKLPDGRDVLFYETAPLDGKNGQDFKKQDVLFFVGMGLNPLMAAQKFAGQPRIVVVERQPAVFDLALRHVDLTPLLTYPYLDLFVGPRFSVSEMVKRYELNIVVGQGQLIRHHPSAAVFGESFLTLERAVRENIHTLMINWNTMKKFGRDMFANAMTNLPSLIRGTPLERLRGKFSGYPVVCVAAGPSLDKELPQLKKIGNQALIIAIDSAVRTLLTAGIRPHMVATVDVKSFNFEKVRAWVDELRDAVLIFSLNANPDNVRAFLGQRRVAVASQEVVLDNWLGPRWQIDCNLPGSMGSVTHGAFFTALVLGGSPIVLAGMDLAHSEGQDHAKDAVFRSDRPKEKMHVTDGVDGWPVYSPPALIADKKRMESAVAENPARFVDTSLAGARIRRAEIRPLGEVISTDFHPEKDVTQVMDSIDWSFPVHDAEVLSTFAEMRQELDRFAGACQQGLHAVPESGVNHGDQDLVRLIASYYDRFQQEHSRLIHLLSPTQLGTLQELFKRNYDIEQNASLSPHERESLAIGIIEDFFRSEAASASFFAEMLQKQMDYFQQVSDLREELTREPGNREAPLSLARIHGEMNELWQADGEYLVYIRQFPDDPLPWAELAECYLSFDLRGAARNHIRRAIERFPQDARVRELDEQIRQDIAGLFEDMKREWERGGKEPARRAMIEYLSLHPDDPQSLQLKAVLDKLDADQVEAFLKTTEIECAPEQRDERVMRAQQWFNSGDIEGAVGILEGLARDFPDEAAYFRKNIGDIRFHQKEFPAAAWHYARASELAPENEGLRNKLKGLAKSL